MTHEIWMFYQVGIASLKIQDLKAKNVWGVRLLEIADTFDAISDLPSPTSKLKLGPAKHPVVAISIVWKRIRLVKCYHNLIDLVAVNLPGIPLCAIARLAESFGGTRNSTKKQQKRGGYTWDFLCELKERLIENKIILHLPHYSPRQELLIPGH